MNIDRWFVYVPVPEIGVLVQIRGFFSREKRPLENLYGGRGNWIPAPERNLLVKIRGFFSRGKRPLQ